jgi:hypothetical protein
MANSWKVRILRCSHAGLIAACAASRTLVDAGAEPPMMQRPDLSAAPSAFAINGYLEGSYNHTSGDGQFTSGVLDRVFDVRNGFTLQRLGVGAEFAPKQGFGGRLDVSFGNDAIAMAPVEAYPGTAKVDLTQAYLQYAVGESTLMAGKLITLLGVEYLQSPLDANFSRGILFGYATPFTHIGARAAHAPLDSVTLYLGLNNGWDHMPGKNSLRTVEFGLVAAPDPSLNVNATLYVGRERAGDPSDPDVTGRRSVLDVVAAWRATPALTLTLNCNWAEQRNVAFSGQRRRTVSWSGQAAYLNFKISDRWSASLRAERFDDADGYRTGIAQRWSEVTATLGFIANTHVEIRGEVRGDSSDVQSFSTRRGNGASDRQYSVGLQVLFMLSHGGR